MIAKTVSVNGIAIRPGVSKNGINYTSEALAEFIPTLANRPILKDHNSTVDNTVGLVTETRDMGNSVVGYKGWVKEDGTGLIEKIEDGRVKEVSIGAFAKRLVKENDDDDFYTAVGLEAMELSLTPTPAVKGTSLQQTLKGLSERATDKSVRVKPIAENFNDFQVFESKQKVKVEETQIKENKEVINMDDDKSVSKEKLREEIMEEQKAQEAKEAELREKLKVEVKEQLEAEAKAAEEARVAAEAKDAELKEAIEKEMREKIQAEMKEKMDKAEPTKGKVTKENVEEETEESSTSFVIENAEFGEGVSLYKMPNSDGSY